MARLGLARTFQHGRVFGNLSVLDNVLIGAHTRLTSARPRGGPLAELALALLRPRRVREDYAQRRREAQAILARFGERLTPRLDHPAHTLSYANRRRVEIARALALRPRLLLLDEPTAGMNPTETAEMEALIGELKREGLTIVLIEHKLDMVMRLSDRVYVLDDGRCIARGPPASVREDPAVVAAYLGAARSPHAEAAE
jgi:branched-chain amino acid transport system ATP-binding protein